MVFGFDYLLLLHAVVDIHIVEEVAEKVVEEERVSHELLAVKDSFAVVVDLDMVAVAAVATFVEDLVVEDLTDNSIAEDYSSSFVKEA